MPSSTKSSLEKLLYESATEYKCGALVVLDQRVNGNKLSNCYQKYINKVGMCAGVERDVNFNLWTVLVLFEDDLVHVMPYRLKKV